MSQRLFSHNQDGCRAIAPWQPLDERQVQRFFECNLPALLDIGFVSSEWCPGNEAFRIDTVAIDREGRPVIIEFKKGQDASVISQALAYRKCVQRHQREFEELVKSRHGDCLIDWNKTRIICIAPNFNAYDLEAVDSIDADIELIRFQFFGRDNIILDTVKSNRKTPKAHIGSKIKRPFSQQLQVASETVKLLLHSLRGSLGLVDDLFETESSEGLQYSCAGEEIARVTLTQGLQPRLKIALRSDPDEDVAAGLGSLRKGKGITETTLRSSGEIPYIVKWITAEQLDAMRAF